jgi:hypothetical protein
VAIIPRIGAGVCGMCVCVCVCVCVFVCIVFEKNY